MASITCRVNFWIYFSFPHFAWIQDEKWIIVMDTCSTYVIFLQRSSAGSRLGRFWALRVWSSGRTSPVFAVYTAIGLRLWVVLFLMSEGRDVVTWADSYSSVLLVSGRGTVSLEDRLLLCHSGLVRRRKSDEDRRHHPFWWSCWCHDCIKPTYSLTGGQNNYYLHSRLPATFNVL